MAFLEIDEVHKSYGHNEVLKGVSLNVERHEVVCLIGASGSGKSTLLRCVNALEEISSGEIRIDGRHRDRRRRRPERRCAATWASSSRATTCSRTCR